MSKTATRDLTEHRFRAVCDGSTGPSSRCRHVAVSATTFPYSRYAGGLRDQEGVYEARMGITITGDDDDSGCPFDEKYRGNYVRAFGPTPESAVRALHDELVALSELIFA